MYLNDAQISVTGYVATQPMVKTVSSGAVYTSMRVAWTPRRQDRETGEWVDGNTSYATVICWRKLATHAALSLRKGDPVMVRGRLSVRPYDDRNGVRRIAVEVEATSVGHDLSRGVAIFQRTRPQTGLTAAQHAVANGDGIGADGGVAAAAASGANAEVEAAARHLDGQLDAAVRTGAAGGSGAGSGLGSGAADDEDLPVTDLPVPDSLADLDDPFLQDSQSSGAGRGSEPVAVPF
jgi:single-strand DNA-binding protein